MPATTLRLKSFEGIRKLLSEKYWLKYVVVNGSRSAFSESTQFREVLIVAEKGKIMGDTIIAMLNSMPANREAALTFAECIRKGEGDDKKQIYILKENQSYVLENINRYLGENQSEVEKLLTNILQNTDKLSRWEIFLKREGYNTLSGIHMWKGDTIYAQKMFILFSTERAIKKHDEWYLDGTTGSSIIAKNRNNGLKVDISLRHVVPSLRRYSGLGKMNISKELDYLIKDEFDKLTYFITGIGKEDLVKWERDIKNKRAHVVIVGRFDISASGTKSLAYYSESEFSPSQMFWLIKGITGDDAKIFALFWNSFINILQILSKKKETRGAFIQILAYSFKDFSVIDCSRVSVSSRENLISLFDEVSRMDLRSVLSRFETFDEMQVRIDNAILEALEIHYTETQLRETYSIIAREIKKLKGVMK